MQGQILKVPSSKKQPTHSETGGQICFDTGTPFHMLSIPTDLQKPCSENGMFIQQQANSNWRLPSYRVCSQHNQQQSRNMIRLILPFAENCWHYRSKIVVEESIKHWKNKTNNLNTNTPQAKPISTSLLFLLRWSKSGSDPKALF